MYVSIYYGTAWRNHKRRVLELGGKCVNCGETDIRVLQINHINGRDNPEVDVRCANCNILYEYERGNLREWPLKIRPWKRWTKQKNDSLIAQVKMGKTSRAIAEILDRSEASIKNQRQKLGLKAVSNSGQFKPGFTPWNKGLK